MLLTQNLGMFYNSDRLANVQPIAHFQPVPQAYWQMSIQMDISSPIHALTNHIVPIPNRML
ncbi:hypothetical protein [Falsihalocynthiibacter sp. CO-5D18]|uniref:hypothetical protein n=1 Tax=Falsihalocynthiibacter sp. CO-5D18 TaxID=3240872 RepID=UPI0035101A23